MGLRQQLPQYKEAVLVEFPPFQRLVTDKATYAIRVRLVKRANAHGKLVPVFDLREHVADTSKVEFTKRGVYIFPEEFDQLISYLQQAKGVLDGSNTGDRGKNSSPH